MEARVDFDRYPNAAKMCRNLLLLPQGGIVRRPGSRYVATAKTSADNTVIWPFQYSETDAWIIEGGDQYLRFYRRQAQITVTATSTAVANGTFTGNATSWSLTGFAYASNQISSTVVGNTAIQALTIGASDQNVLHCLYFRVTGKGTVTLDITSAAAASLGSFTRTEGYHIVEFTPTDGTATLTFTNKGSTTAASPVLALDNVAIVQGAMELVSPYDKTVVDLNTIRTFQAADVMYLLHNSYPTHRVSRYATRTWSLTPVDWGDGPYLDFNLLDTDTEVFDLNAVQLIANPFFENGLVGWTDASSGDGNIIYTANGAELDDGTSGGSGVATLRTSFAGQGSSVAFVLHTFIVNQDMNIIVGTTAGGAEISASAVLRPGWNHTAFSSAAATIHIEYEILGHTGERSAVAASICYQQNARFMSLSAATGAATLTAVGFTPFVVGDVGRLLRLSYPG